MEVMTMRDNKLSIRYPGIFRAIDDFFDEFDIGRNYLSSDNNFMIFRKIDDIEDIENGKRLLIPVPGRDKNNIEVTVDGDTLKISAKKEESKIGKLFKSFSTDEFATIYNISEFDSENIDAKIENGILSIDLKYKIIPKDKSKKIEVK